MDVIQQTTKFVSSIGMNLIFVYNADNGLFNAITDTVHKVMSPETYDCRLCAFTYGIAGMLRKWKNYLELIERKKIFLHRNEFRRKYPELAETKLPAIFVEGKSAPSVLVSAEEIDACQDLEDLIRLLDRGLGAINDLPSTIDTR